MRGAVVRTEEPKNVMNVGVNEWENPEMNEWSGTKCHRWIKEEDAGSELM